MNWKSTCTLDSETMPGVRVICKRFTHERRAALELELIEYRDQLREKMLAYAENIENKGLLDNDGNFVLDEDGKPKDAGDSDFIRAQKATRRRAFDQWASGGIEVHIKPATIRAYVTRVEGLSVDDVPVITGADLAERAPDVLCDEVYLFIHTHGGLSDEERKNSPSPSTSPEAEGGPMKSTTAASAEQIVISNPAIVDVLATIST